MSTPPPIGRDASEGKELAPGSSSRRQAPTPAAGGPSARGEGAHVWPAAGRSGNPLLFEADALLALAPELRATTCLTDLARLRANIAEMLREFEVGARVRGVNPERRAKARAVLCALIDDVVSSMPWGADAGWEPMGTSLAAKDGQDVTDGPVQRLLHVARDASADRDLQELICVALALGFDGRARGAAAGAEELAQIRAQLAAQLRGNGPDAGPVLSPHWRGAAGGGSALASWLALWVMGLVTAALLAVLYFSLILSLGAKSDRIYAQIAALRAPASATPRPLPESQARLAAPLSTDIAAHRISVRDEIDRSVVVLPGGGLFEPGTAKLLASGSEPLGRIAAALQRAPGRVLVAGHTDGKSARSAQYPSDWDLSVDRARAVHDALRGFGIEAARLRYDGRADTEPLAVTDGTGFIPGNDRIEIVLLAGR